MKLSFLLGLVLFCSSSFAASTDELVRSLNEVSAFFENPSGPTALSCPPTDSEKRSGNTCSLEPLCREVSRNSDKPYLFRTESGAIPNFVLREAVSENIVQCLNEKRNLLMSESEQSLTADLEAADAGTRSAYQNFMNREFESLINRERSPLFSRVGENAALNAIVAELKLRAPGITNPKVLQDLSQVITLRHAGARQLNWQSLIGETFKPADPALIQKTFSEAKSTLQSWLKTSGKKFSSPSMMTALEALNVIVETTPDPQSQNCSPQDIAYFNMGTNRMVICPKGAALPKGGLFLVLAHELGHSVSRCNLKIDPDPLNDKAWDDVNACLANPVTGPAPKAVSWKNVRDIISTQTTDQNKLASVSADLDSGIALNRPYACLQNAFTPRFQALGLSAPNDQTEETQADWVSTQVVQLFSTSMSTSAARQFAFEGLSPSILKRGCDLTRNKLVPKVEAALKAAGCTDQKFTAATSMQKDTGGDEHIEPDRRFKVHLSTPIFRQAMGCTGPAKGCQ